MLEELELELDEELLVLDEELELEEELDVELLELDEELEELLEELLLVVPPPS